MSPSSSLPTTEWQLAAATEPPQWLIELVQGELIQLYPAPERGKYESLRMGQYAAQLLWQRGLHDPDQVKGFLRPEHYVPTDPFAFGPEMEQAVVRLQQARTGQERVAIWGDFDADGVTATAVLWEGLGAWLPPERLSYYIPDRFRESHGLSARGLRQLAQQGVSLVVTCDTGSGDRPEIDLAQSLGIEIIITDHHSLPPQRPPVVALINPRSLPPAHPLASLSGVAVAYKLIEALQQRYPRDPDPCPALLELVAIGLIADLVDLQQDSRYLAQVGLQRLQQLTRSPQQRPGVAELLKRCQRSGDRPTDISFGIGPRINAVSRIQGDAGLCVELLTSRDSQRCQHLAEQVELLNTRRKGLQQRLGREVRARVAELDLSTTAVIVLGEVGWPLGVLGLVASEMARETGKPTVLLSFDPPAGEGDLAAKDLAGADQAGEPEGAPMPMARGSARSVHQIDFYPILASQRSLLHRFGGHPYAAGLVLPLCNLELFTVGINQQLRSQFLQAPAPPPVVADLSLSVAELGPRLFRELKLLEPCGMGNPVPKLLIRNCWCEQVRHSNIKDAKGGRVRYIKTEFQLLDASAKTGFPGVWWGHYQEELPRGRCDLVGELDFNAYQKRYEFRLVAVRPAASELEWVEQLTNGPLEPRSLEPRPLELQSLDWRRPETKGTPTNPGDPDPQWLWLQLLGVAKYLARTGDCVAVGTIQERLGLSDRLMELAWGAIADLGFEVFHPDSRHVTLRLDLSSTRVEPSRSEGIVSFIAAVQEARFRRRYLLAMPSHGLGGQVLPKD